MAFFSDDDLENDEGHDNEFKELYGVRDGILFIIDASPPMFEIDPVEGTPYFLQCIRQYKEILKQKLVWDKQDWMGLILFATEKCDLNSEIKNIVSLQKLSLVSMDSLKVITNIDEEKKWEHYRDNASSTVYPLHDVLWHAAREFSAIGITMPLKRIILFTCQDSPPLTDDNEKHRIRVKAASYSDLGLQLSVVGLGKTWNHNLFYKDLEIISEKIDADDYKRTLLKDLVEQVKLPSRNMAKLPWRLGENVTLDISLRNLSVKTQYLKKANISKETNTALITSTHLTTVDNDDTKENLDSDHESSPVLEMDIRKYQTFGNRNIYFTLAEVRSLCTTREPGIDLICIKPISYHPIYHFKSPYFVIPNKSDRKDNKLLFAALLHKCDTRNLMIICTVTIRKHSAANLYSMIPNENSGGFYLYKIPFKEEVRRISDYFPQYMFDNNENMPPTDPKEIELLEKIIKKLSIDYDPKLFPNPKLQVQLQTLETLALDMEKRELPPDNTLPKIDKMRELAGDLLDEYDEIFRNEEGDLDDVQPKKKHKKVNEAVSAIFFENTEQIELLVTKGQIATCTVPQLKTILKTLCLKTSGKKEELINRIREHYN